MSPSEVRTMSDAAIVEMLVSLRPSDERVAWLASVIADPAKVVGVNELSRRYAAASEGRPALRAKNAGSVLIDGAKFKELMWRHRIPLVAVGPAIGKCEGCQRPRTQGSDVVLDGRCHRNQGARYARGFVYPCDRCSSGV